jgi:hypothetical protein
MPGDQVLSASVTRPLDNRLGQVFPEGEIYGVTDDEWLALAASYYGLRSVLPDEAGKLPRGASVVLFLRHGPAGASLVNALRAARVLAVGVYAYDPSIEAALYTQKLAMLTDYVAACARNRSLARRIRAAAGPLAPVAARVAPVIGAGQWVDAGSYGRLSLAPSRWPAGAGFGCVDGTATACGVLVTRMAGTCSRARVVSAAHRLRAELTAAGTVVLRTAGGVVTSIRAGERDLTGAVGELVSQDGIPRVHDLAIGTNASIATQVMWKVNSQLNAGAGGLLLGLGGAAAGVRLEFILSPGSVAGMLASDGPAGQVTAP